MPVTVVSAIRLGVHNHPTQYVLTFSGALDPVQAANLAHYQLVEVNSRGKVISAPIVLGAAVYDPTAHTVTLLPVHKVNVHYDYRLTITGLTDASGHPIVGSNGQPGGNYVTRFSLASYEAEGVNISRVSSSASSRTTRLAPHAAAFSVRVSNVHSGNGVGIHPAAVAHGAHRTILHMAHPVS